MPETWTKALSDYEYPVRLSDYNRADQFPDYFIRNIPGNRASTIQFEDRFRVDSGNCVEPYFEVVFWKLYSQANRCQKGTDRVVEHVLQNGVAASDLRCAIDSFVERPTRTKLSVLRALLGMKTPVLAVALTFPAFVDPAGFPMVDMQTAKWITSNYLAHNRNRTKALTPFKLNCTVLQDNDFQNYLNWVRWCREVADVLTDRTDIEWRARDIDMAVFTAAREGLPLNVLP